MWRRLRRLWIALTAVALGCGGGEEEPGGGAATPARAAPATASGPTGTLTLGDRTFTFRVQSCDLGEVQSVDGETLRGTGQTEDGQRFTVVVSQGGGNTEIHQVALTYGAVMSGSGFVARAMRSKVQGGDWPADAQGAGPAGPLVRIEGRTVRAAATFSVDDSGKESWVPGRLDATCP